MMYSWYNHSFAWNPWYFGFGAIGLLVTLVVVAALIALKGYALWHAARRSEKVWFVALLILNTIGILEIVYLFFIVGRWHQFKDKGTTPAATPAAGSAPQA